MVHNHNVLTLFSEFEYKRSGLTSLILKNSSIYMGNLKFILIMSSIHKIVMNWYVPGQSA
jgi:hypothetical protein